MNLIHGPILVIEDYNRVFIVYQINSQIKKSSIRLITKSYNIIYTTLSRYIANKTYSY